MRLLLFACVVVACQSKRTDGAPAEATSERRGIATATAPSAPAVMVAPPIHLLRGDAGTQGVCHMLDGTKVDRCDPNDALCICE